MKKLNFKLGGIGEMLTKEQMKKVVGGDYGGKKGYQCCPGPGDGGIDCSDCVEVKPGETATCTQGNKTACTP
ncbi:MAG TPA: hypothetical protein VNI52_00335 [Sphingobacteriaceae bacterium]|nr:hypothetical protein [Sphingobacteriaceae bacterium]